MPIIIKSVMFLIKSLRNVLQEMQVLHIIWFLLLIGLLMFTGRSSKDISENPLQLVKWLRVFPVLFGFVVTTTHLLNRGDFGILFRGPLLLFFFYCISSLFSITYSKEIGYSAWKATELMISFMAIAAIISSYKKENAVVTVNIMNFAWNNALLITVLLGAILFPNLAFHKPYGAILPQLHGVIPLINANTVGLMAAIAILYILWNIIDGVSNRSSLILLLIFVFTLFVFAQSRTSMLGLSIAVIYLFYFRRKPKLLIASMIILIVVLISSLSFFRNLFTSYVLRGQSIDAPLITTVSGRTVGWEKAIDKFMESPIYGYGIASGARYSVLAEVPGREEQGALHNAFLDVLINNGIIGFIPWILSYLWTFILLLKRNMIVPEDKTASLLASIMVLFSVRMLTGDILIYHDNSTLMFLGILAYAQILHLEKLGFKTVARCENPLNPQLS
jgi:O-antigen ligase